jgi:FAD/FMN-containing dehydrogenase
MTQTQRADSGLLGAVADRVRGEIVDRAHPEYEHARRVDNGSIDRRPELIVRCVDAGDVVAALGAGREAGVDIAVRGRGHSVPGFGTVDDGLVIDLSPIRNVRVDPGARVADVGGGAALGDVDHATHAFGLATPLGIVSATGVGGLTLGGGQGYLTRKHGLTIDNLVSADVVLADGSFVRASDDENADLMWALRGGSGNFGIVTSFRYRLHPLTTVVSGPMLWPLERAEEVMRFYRDFIPEAPEELSGLFAFITVPPGPPFPEELHLEKMAGVVWCWAGPPSKADEALAPVRALSPALDGVGGMPYPAIQTAFDALYPSGLQNYWRAHVFDRLSDEAIERHVDGARRLPTPLSAVIVYPTDGAAARVGADETAWGHRDARWSVVILGIDPDPANFESLRAWTVECWEALAPYALGGAYVNFTGDNARAQVRPSYGRNYERLAELKRKYDPDNVFHVNQNIEPAR